MCSCYCCISDKKKCLISEKSYQCNAYIYADMSCDLMILSAKLHCVKNKIHCLCKEKAETKVRK